ncbi:MAG: hypothetical protein JEZ05_08870 [Tenericutes bacterium]|nr:hypothetical protein [Mycoplasmatota bacterium]
MNKISKDWLITLNYCSNKNMLNKEANLLICELPYIDTIETINKLDWEKLTFLQYFNLHFTESVSKQNITSLFIQFSHIDLKESIKIQPINGEMRENIWITDLETGY